MSLSSSMMTIPDMVRSGTRLFVAVDFGCVITSLRRCAVVSNPCARITDVAGARCEDRVMSGRALDADLGIAGLRDAVARNRPLSAGLRRACRRCSRRRVRS